MIISLSFWNADELFSGMSARYFIFFAIIRLSASLAKYRAIFSPESITFFYTGQQRLLSIIEIANLRTAEAGASFSNLFPSKELYLFIFNGRGFPVQMESFQLVSRRTSICFMPLSTQYVPIIFSH